MLVNSISWLAVCFSGQLLKSTLHLYPFAPNEKVPRKVKCLLTLFQSEPIKIIADGVRLGQPIGFRLEQAFPNCNFSTPMPLLIEMQLSNLDLRHSDCVIELTSQLGSVKYHPLLYSNCERKLEKNCSELCTNYQIIALQDNVLNSKASVSLWSVNQSDDDLSFKLSSDTVKNEDLTVKAHTVLETVLPCGGVILNSQLSHYVVYRKSQNIVAINGVEK